MKTGNLKLLADTNIILYLFHGNEAVRELLEGHEIFISVITEIELLRFPTLTTKQFDLIRERLAFLKIIEINTQVKEIVYKISREKKIKLFDCIIAATASHLNIPLLTADKVLTHIPYVNTIIVNI